MEVNVVFSIDLKTFAKKCDLTVEEFKETYSDEKSLNELIEEILEERLSKFGFNTSNVEVVSSEYKLATEIFYDDDLSSEEEIPSDITDLIEYFVELTETFESYDFVKAYADDEDDLPDSSWTSIFHVKRGSRTFALEVEFHTEWCGDWSVRKNLPDGFTIKNVTETTC